MWAWESGHDERKHRVGSRPFQGHTFKGVQPKRLQYIYVILHFLEMVYLTVGQVKFGRDLAKTKG